MPPQNVNMPSATGAQYQEFRPLEGRNVLYNVIVSGLEALIVAFVVGYLPKTLEISLISELSSLFLVIAIVAATVVFTIRFKLRAHQALIITDKNVIILSGYTDQTQIPKDAIKKVNLFATKHQRIIVLETVDGSTPGISPGWSLATARKIIDAIASDCNLPAEKVYDDTTIGSPAFKKIMFTIFVIVVVLLGLIYLGLLRRIFGY